jgi:hypothetical protein
MDQYKMTWRHDSILNYIAGCLKSALVSKSTAEIYCNLERLLVPGGRSIPTDILAQAETADLVIRAIVRGALGSQL